MALAQLGHDASVRVAGLLTTVTEGFDRISMHGVRRSLLERQAAALGLPLHIVWIPQNATNQEYESRMEAALDQYRSLGVSTVAFGDLFLADIRAYREAWLSRLSVMATFPLWHRETGTLAEAFVTLGFQAVVTCVDRRVLPREFVGRSFDRRFLADLPSSVDPCGERGEFHTFVHGGPLFAHEVPVTRGEVVDREDWSFCELLAH